MHRQVQPHGYAVLEPFRSGLIRRLGSSLRPKRRVYTIQRNAVLTPVDCKGRYGAPCSSDLVTLVVPDYRHRATFTWDSEPLTVQVGWTFRRSASIRTKRRSSPLGSDVATVAQLKGRSLIARAAQINEESTPPEAATVTFPNSVHQLPHTAAAIKASCSAASSNVTVVLQGMKFSGRQIC